MSREAVRPPSPSRVRVVRPGFFRSAVTGSLAPDVRDLVIGLCTVADDEGWLLWDLEELASTIYPYTPGRRRTQELARRSEILTAAGLLVIEPCGCALLTTLKEHHGITSGRQTAPIWGWHMKHAALRGIPGNSAAHPSSSSSSSSLSSSSSFEGSSSSRAGDGSPGAMGSPVCPDCKRPREFHAANCPVRLNPALERVNA